MPLGFETGRTLSLDELRFYALYWDKVVIPTNNFIHLGLPQEDDFISAGVIERPLISFTGSMHSEQVPDFLLRAQILVAEELMKDKNTDWVIQQLGHELALPKAYSLKRDTLRIDLANCLPVPSGDININDILEFKERRKNEFLALHEHLDELYEQTLLSPDQSLASKKAVSRLVATINELDKVTQERFSLFNRHDLTTILNIYGKKIQEGIIMDLVAASFTGKITPIVTIGGVISATIKVSSQSEKIFRPAQENLKLAYLSSAKKEGFI